MILCVSGLPAGGLQMFAWLQMARDAGGLSQLERVMISAPACDLCLLSRQLANGTQEERRDGRERALLKADPATALAGHHDRRKGTGTAEDLHNAWHRSTDLRVPPGQATRPPTPPPRHHNGPNHA